ncbi:ComF family protein [Pseudaestuariivita sp.]|uniref:ComF family protein n=1 Tax=Pseudaestuariivita sp. TaxID=2211669 RepID=UPI004058BBF4
MYAQLQTALRVLYPPSCLACGAEVVSDFGLCGACWRDTHFIDTLSCDLCGIPLPGHSGGVETCDTCLRHPPPWTRGRAAVTYEKGGRRMVLSLKHGDRTDLARPAAAWMADRLQGLVDEDSLLVPVPLHRWRLAKRRYNQAALLARALAREVGCETCPDALVRLRPTRSLGRRSREARFAELAGAIGVHPRRKALLEGRRIVLVDDVLASGATLWEATHACRTAAPQDVSIAVLARALWSS